MGYSGHPEEGDDIIDSRDVIERISDLEAELDEALEDGDIENPEEFDDYDELVKLRELAEEGEGFSEWPHGAVMVRDGYFEDYAQQFAEDIGAINPDAAWPANCIDWEQAARELQTDYGSVEFGNTTYYVR